MLSKKQKQLKNGFIYVAIKSREEVYYEGEALSLTSYNDKGVFDVLPNHANFISLIDKYVKLIKSDGLEFKLDISHSVIHVIMNRVTIYCNINK